MNMNIDQSKANQCRNSQGETLAFASLPGKVREDIIFADETGLALWRTEGDGYEPPPYWVDENGDIHNL